MGYGITCQASLSQESKYSNHSRAESHQNHSEHYPTHIRVGQEKEVNHIFLYISKIKFRVF
jgi:hypothetical protein